MKKIVEGITLTDGTPLVLDVAETAPIIGYQAEHVQTGRLLPMCSRFEVYDIISLHMKMAEVAEYMDECGFFFDIWKYEAVPIREEIEGSKYVIINFYN